MRRLIATLALCSLVGCGMFDFTSPRKRNRQLTQPGMPHLAAGEIPEGSPRITTDKLDGPTVDKLAPDQPGMIVLILLDSVRADHTHLCGGDVPNTPSLDALRDKGAAVSCQTYAPATWSLPATASIFTGLDPDKHGLVTRGAHLDPALPTLAAEMSARGYQTVLISASPLLGEATGLQRGFHEVRVAEKLDSEYRAEGVVKMLRYLIAQVDPKRPIFLTLNLFDAHDPYPEVPAKLDWVKAQDAVNFQGPDGTAVSATKLMAGALAEPARSDFVDRLTAGYDHGVFVDDTVVGNVARVIERFQLGKHGLRVVVTGTHGENLGEHDSVRHGGVPWESVSRVPLLMIDSTQKDTLKLPDLMSTTGAFYLVRDGKLPDPPAPVKAMSFDEGGRLADPRFKDAVALWLAPGVKLLRVDGQSLRFDLKADPTESKGAPVTDKDELAALDALAKSATDAEARALTIPADPGVSQLFSRLGDAD